jgi:hypothetical protein
VTYDAVQRLPAPPPGEEQPRWTTRALITPTGQLLDLISKEQHGRADAVESEPILSLLEQRLYLDLPQLPERAVKSGDKLFEYERDLARFDDALGAIRVRVTGTVRGTTTHNGRRVLFVEYRGTMPASDLPFEETGYELIDLETGIVTAVHGNCRLGTKWFVVLTCSHDTEVTFR